MWEWQFRYKHMCSETAEEFAEVPDSYVLDGNNAPGLFFLAGPQKCQLNLLRATSQAPLL